MLDPTTIGIGRDLVSETLVEANRGTVMDPAAIIARGIVAGHGSGMVHGRETTDVETTVVNLVIGTVQLAVIGYPIKVEVQDMIGSVIGVEVGTRVIGVEVGTRANRKPPTNTNRQTTKPRRKSCDGEAPKGNTCPTHV